MATPIAPRGHLRYLIGGLIIGGFWFLNRGQTPLEEALRTIATFTVIMVIMRARLKHKSVDLHLVPLVAAKALLVVIAALVQEALKNSMGDPASVVAVGLGLAVALLGPLGDHAFFTRTPPTATIPESIR